MKKIIVSGVLGLFMMINTANAQTEKGTLLLGGNVANINLGITEGLGSSISLTPSAGYFVSDGFAVGASLPISKSGNKNDESWGSSKTSNTTFGLGVYGRYYFIQDNPLSFFAGLGLGVNNYYTKTKTDFDSNLIEDRVDKYSSSDFYSGVNVGAAYFLNDALAIEGVLSTSDITEDYLSLNFGFGFKYYFKK